MRLIYILLFSILFQVGSNAYETIVATTANFKTDQYGDYRITGATNSVLATNRFTDNGSMMISGSGGTATVTYTSSDSAEQIAAAINLKTDDTGVTASAISEAELIFGASGAYRFTLTSENTSAVEIGFNIGSTTGNDALSQAVNAFNDHQAKTGVVATIKEDGSGITLTNYDGKDIDLRDTTFTNAGIVSPARVSRKSASRSAG